MKTFFYTVLLVLLSFPVLAQDEEEVIAEEEETEEEMPVHEREIGFDLNFSASNFGGTAGLGLKLGFNIQEKFIAGPSIRFQQSWSTGVAINGGTGVNSSFSIYGGGGFIHARLFNYFFVGAEVELLSTPFQNGFLMAQRVWVPTALVGGGFSRAFTPNFRLNAGVMYDVIDNVNSPFRQGYFMKRANGTYIPVMYRIAFFFPI